MLSRTATAAIEINAIRLACLDRGYVPVTTALYCKLLNELVPKWHAHSISGDVSDMLRNVDWVEATMKDMYMVKSMPTYIGYIVSVLKAYPAEELPLGKRRPEMVPAWYVYAERCAFWRGVVYGMKGEIVETEHDGSDDVDDDVVPTPPLKKSRVREFLALLDNVKETIVHFGDEMESLRETASSLTSDVLEDVVVGGADDTQ